MLRRAVCFLLLCLVQGGLFSQNSYWCDEFAVPDTEATEPFESDSGSVEIASAVSLYDMFKVRNRLDWKRRLSHYSFEQSAEYQLQQRNPRSWIQSVDFSGMLVHRNFIIDGLDAGFEWSPIVSYSRRPAGTMQGSVDIGPVISKRFFSIPFSIRGGLYGYAWNDSIASLAASRPSEYHMDQGFYANCKIGDPLRRISSLPVYLSIDATGRAIRGNNIVLMSASAMYADELSLFGGGDSFFLHAGDSLTNGKEIYLGDSTGKSLLSNTSWRIKHSFSGSGGMKSKERLGMQMRLYYSYYQNSISYPSKIRTIDDIRTTGNKLGLGVNTSESGILSYNGGIEFIWEFEDWLYRHKFGPNEVLNRENRDSLIVNQSDHFSDIANMQHTIQVRLPWNLTSRYSVNAFRDSKKYPFAYFDPSSPGNPRKNQNENDRVRINQTASVRLGRDSLKFAELYGSYGKLYHYYYRAQRQAESRQTREYRIGLDAGISTKAVEIREHVYADAEVTDYYFKKVIGKPLRAPPYARDVTSTLSGKWKILDECFHLSGKWIEIYHDNGLWYGNEYRSDRSASGREYYAIERKGTQYWFDVSMEYIHQIIKLTAGSMFRDVFQRRFDLESGSYVVSELDLGYGIEPYLLIEWRPDFIMLNMKLKRIINTQDKQRWNFEKNWDLSLSLHMVF